MKPLANQVALVTGAGSGIGRAIAAELAAQGAELVLVGRRLALLQEAAAGMKHHETPVRCIAADVADRENLSALVNEFTARFDGLDTLVHSAGIVRAADFAEATDDDFDVQYRTNLLAPSLLSQGLLPLLARRRGQVVFINSSVGVSAKPRFSQYSATKHALKAIADSLRAEVNVQGIRVLSVFPGQTATPAQAALYAQEGKAYRPESLLQPADIASIVGSVLCLPRTAEVTDLHIRPTSPP